MWGFFVSAYQPSGVMFNSYAFKIMNSTDISEIIGTTSITFDGQMNLTEVKINNQSYFVKNASEEGLIVAFEDTAALRSGLAGIIVEINDEKIGNYEDMKTVFRDLNPGDTVIIKTLYKDEIKSYEISLGERSGRPFLGIVLIGSSGGGIIGAIRESLMFFKEPNTYYAPKFFGDLTIFIYNLLWWMVFINLSVALGNMLPLGIFDGGRFFYITLKGITKSERFSKKVFSVVTYFLLFVFLLLMISWAFSVF
jgi:membrane-associated protease RseP (regulator of RpoE activity)